MLQLKKDYKLNRLSSDSEVLKSPHSVNYLHKFWTNLLKEIILKLRRRLRARLTVNNHSIKVPTPLRRVVIYFLFFFLGLILARPSTVVIHNPQVPVKVHLVSALKMPPLAHIEPPERMLHPLMAYGTYANDYAPGNCTQYVASRIQIPNSMGNANQWDDYLADYISHIPEAGVIAQTDGDSYLGHVAVVVSVNPDGSFVVSEMNGTLGLGMIDTRTTTTAEFPNFIYY